MSRRKGAENAAAGVLNAVVPQCREPLSELLNEHEVARITGRSVRTLQADRVHGDGIPFCKLGRLVRYRRQDVEAYIAARIVTSTSAPRVQGAEARP